MSIAKHTVERIFDAIERGVRPWLTFLVTSTYNLALLWAFATNKITFQEYFLAVGPASTLILGFWFGERQAMRGMGGMGCALNGMIPGSYGYPQSPLPPNMPDPRPSQRPPFPMPGPRYSPPGAAGVTPPAGYAVGGLVPPSPNPLVGER